MKKLLTLVAMLMATSSAFAQDTNIIAEATSSPNYLVVILAGVLLAFGFQFLLTALSVAAGVSAIGNIKKSYVHNKYKGINFEKKHDDDDDDDEYEIDPDMTTGVKVTAAVGLWNVVTVGLSLFGATFLALQIMPQLDLIARLSLGLVIWATFFMMMFYLETKMVGTLLGGLISTAVAGLKSSASMVTSLFAKSPKTEIEDVASTTIEKIRAEFATDIDTDAVLDTVRSFSDRLSKDVPSYETLKNDLKEIVETAAKQRGRQSSTTSSKWMALQTMINGAIQVAGNTNTDAGKQKVNDLKELLAEAKRAYDKGDTFQEGIKNVVALSPADEEKFDQQINKIKKQFHSSDLSEVDMNNMEKELNLFIKESKGKAAHFVKKMKQVDRDTVVKELTKNSALDRSQINDYADRIEQMMAKAAESVNKGKIQHQIDTIKEKLKNSSLSEIDIEQIQASFNDFVNHPQAELGKAAEKIKQLDRKTIVDALDQNTSLDRGKINEYANRLEHLVEQFTERLAITNNNPQIDNLLVAFEGKVKSFVDSTDADELQYRYLKNDIKRALNNPKESLSIIKNRLDTFDKDTLMAILTNTPWIDKKHIHKISQTIEEAKHEVTLQVQKINDKAVSAMNRLERKAVIQAEHLRQTAAVAAWWLVATIVLSAGAAIGGALLVA